MDQLFYCTQIENGLARLDEEESGHLVQVLRRKAGDTLHFTDGCGFFYMAEIVETGKKHTLARVVRRTEAPPEGRGRLHIAITPTKQIDRFEWFLEKVTEIGVDMITPLYCQRSERDTLRHDRLEKIIRSAMKQSWRARLPVLNQLTPFRKCVDATIETDRFIPWIPENTAQPHLQTLLRRPHDTIILIGPAGDFTPEEAAYALERGFVGASLGAARLRTETAGLFVAAGFNFGQ